MRRVVGLFVGLCLLAVGLAAAPTSAAAAAVQDPHIGGFGIEYAPKHKKGAIVLPWMGCDGSDSNDVTITNIKTKKTIHRSWMFGMSLRVSAPRHLPGDDQGNLR